MKKMLTAAAAVATMLMLSGCGAKTPQVGEMSADPKAAQYGVVIYSGEAAFYEATPEQIRAGQKGKLVGGSVNGNGSITIKTMERQGALYVLSQLKFGKDGKQNAEVIIAQPQRFSHAGTGEGKDTWWSWWSMPFQPANLQVNPGEVVYIGHHSIEAMEISYGLMNRTGVTRVSVTDREKEAWAYVDTLPNIKNWPRRNATQVFEFRANDVAKAMTSKGCTPTEEILKDKTLKAGEPCETGMVIEYVNGEKKVTYNNYPFVDFVAKHGAK